MERLKKLSWSFICLSFLRICFLLFCQLSILNPQSHLLILAANDAPREDEVYFRNQEGKHKPNIVFILADDLGWGNVGFHRNIENKEVITPTLNKLATIEGRSLNRHYVHKACTPTRSSLYTGRIPQHVTAALRNPCNPSSGIPKKMTAIAEKLKSAGYETHFVGKWDAGMATPEHTPKGRGFKSSLNYFSHGNWMFTANEWKGSEGNATKIPSCTINHNCYRDLWDTDHPAYSLTKSPRYEEIMFRDRFNQILDQHYNANKNLDPDQKKPLFLVYASRLAHYPLQPLKTYEMKFEFIPQPNRRAYAAMVNFLDDQVANLTEGLKIRNMWKDTLLVFSSDNGGYIRSANPCIRDMRYGSVTVCLNGEAGASNFPLRGGKYTNFEGGVRAASFVSGGLIPASVRNRPVDGIIHIADWYATFCDLAGINPADRKAEVHGLPPIDSLSVWNLISTDNASSPRTEVFLDSNALIQNDLKLLLGVQRGAGWAGPIFPNSTGDKNIFGITIDCRNGCLYNVSSDPTEHLNVAASFPDIVKTMNTRLRELRATIWSQPDTGEDPNCRKIAKSHWKGFLGPFLELENRLNDQPINITVQGNDLFMYS